MQLATARHAGIRPECAVAPWRRPSRCTRVAVAAQKPIFVDRSPSEEMLKAKGVKSWPKWGCGVSKFPWTWSEDETAYILEGEALITPDSKYNMEPVRIKAGDFCVFPGGMSCTWDVSKPIDKHYSF